MAALMGCTGPVAPARPSAGSPVTATATATAIASPMPTATPVARFEVDYQEPTKTYGGDARVIELYVPKLAPGATAPLVVVLHAYNSSPFAVILASRFDLVAARYGAIVVAPPAASRGWDAEVSSGQSPKPNADTRYLAALLADLKASLPIDSTRVFVTGFSFGAVMTDRLGCEFADQITAIAIDAGESWSDTCRPAQPISVLVLHGTSDSTFDYAGAQSLAARWRRVDECTGDPVTSQLGPTTTAESIEGCKAGTAVELVTIAGGIHMWFRDPNATELAWQFFTAHPRH
jgi:polyhydroxybutyrate depolymerase